MDVIAFVSRPALQRLAASLRPLGLLPRSPSVVDASRALHSAAVSLLVVDPNELRSDAFAFLIDAACAAGTPVVLHTKLTEFSAQCVLEVSRRIPVEVVFSDVEDDVSLIRRLATEAGRTTTPALFLRGISARVDRLPQSIETMVVSLFGWRPIPDSVSALAVQLGIPARSIERWFQRTGLNGIARLLGCARLSRAWETARRLHRDLAHVAQLAGFSSAPRLTACCRSLTDLTFSHARSNLTDREFADRLIKAALR